MRVPDSALNEVRERGFSLFEGFLSPPELREAQEALWLHFPRPEDYFASAEGSSRFGASQFAGVEEFPYRSRDLNGLAVHPDLVDMAERYLETTQLHLYKVELWAKYAGAVDYDQPLHRDFGSHSLVVPRQEARYQQVTTFLYLSDVTDEDAPTCIVPYQEGRDVPYTPLYLPFGSLADAEVRCTGSAGSLLVYRTDILHRGSNFLAPGRSRSRSSPTSRSGGRPGAARWRGPSSHPSAGPSSSPNAASASATCSASPARATPIGIPRRSREWRRDTPESTWRPTGSPSATADRVSWSETLSVSVQAALIDVRLRKGDDDRGEGLQRDVVHPEVLDADVARLGEPRRLRAGGARLDLHLRPEGAVAVRGDRLGVVRVTGVLRDNPLGLRALEQLDRLTRGEVASSNLGVGVHHHVVRMHRDHG